MSDPRETLERMVRVAVELNTKGAGDELMPERIQAALRELVEMHYAENGLDAEGFHRLCVVITELEL